MLVELEWRGLGTIEDFQGSAVNFYLTSGHIGVNRGFTSGAHLARNLEHIFGSNLVRLGKELTGIGVKHHLNNALTVTQINKYNPTVIATTINPATESNFFINIFACDQATIVRSIHLVSIPTLNI